MFELDLESLKTLLQASERILKGAYSNSHALFEILGDRSERTRSCSTEAWIRPAENEPVGILLTLICYMTGL